METEKPKYYETFKNKNKEKINETVECDICKGSYKYFNKYHHIKTSRHQNALRFKTEYENKFNNNN